MSNKQYGSDKTLLIGHGIDVNLNQLDPGTHEGAVVYSEEQIYFSNGSDWVIPQDDVDIARPRGLPPTTSLEAVQLRLSIFRSPTGETQTGIIFEVSTTPEFTTPLFTRSVSSTTANLYQIQYPEDGIEPGDTIWWRGKYLGTNSTQSSFSLPIAQTFPQLIDNPTAITREGAITAILQLTPYFSAFGLNYVETEVEIYEESADVLVDSFTAITGGSVLVPETLTEGLAYRWRARYTGRVGASGPVLETEWTAIRSFFNGARSIVLVYDPALALSRTINIPLGMHPPESGQIVDVVVDWGDGTSNTYTTAGSKSHTYGTGFTELATVTVSGQLTQYGGNVNQQGLVAVNFWGLALGLTSLRGALRNTTSNLSSITPTLPPQVTDLSEFFQSSNLTADITDLDVSYATNISRMFYASGISQNLSDWDTSNVQNMQELFSFSTSAGPNCSGWDVSSVTNVYRLVFSGLFNNTFSLGNWDSLASMEEMFVQTNISGRTHPFNQPINYWDVSNVTNMRLTFGMLGGGGASVAYSFNQPLDDWDVSNVTDMSYMFGVKDGITTFTISFNQNINGWDTSSVTTMEGMFSSTSTNARHPFNTSISDWDVSSCTNFTGMFRASSYNQSLANWVLSTDPTKNVNMSNMFENALFNNSSITNWNTIRITNMSYIFRNHSTFNQPIGSWNTSNATNMSGMFSAAFAFNQPLNNWDVSSVVNMSNMFESSFSFDQLLNLWDTSSVENMSYMFAHIAGGSTTTLLFNQNINDWDTSNVTDMSYMFGCVFAGFSNKSSLFNSPIGDWDVSSVTTMQGMFARTGTTTGANSFNQDISQWNLNPNGVLLTDFMRVSGGTLAFSTENYSKLLAGWANTVDAQNGPYALLANFGTRKYNTTDYFIGERFEDAVQGRAYLVGANQLSVTGAGDTNANGTYSFTGGLYVNTNDWYFVKEGGLWLLKDDSDVTQATQQDVGDIAAPQYVVTWNGDLSAATVLRTGAVWTITDGGPA